MSKLPKNVGYKDSAVRFFLAAVLLAVIVYLKPAFPINWILYGLILILGITAQFRFCPIYFIAKIKTNTKE